VSLDTSLLLFISRERGRRESAKKNSKRERVGKKRKKAEKGI
jgi:hypothetical protein